MRLTVGSEQRELAEGVRAFARERIAPLVADGERAGQLPKELIAELARLGVLGMTVPEAFGGAGADSVSQVLVLEELAAVWPSLAVCVSVNNGIASDAIFRFGSEAQRRRWLPRLCDGSGLAAFSLTEPRSGSDAARLRATAIRDGDGYRISGSKVFVTNARQAPVIIVLARVGKLDEERPHRGITAFLVEAGAPGLTIGRHEEKMGLHAGDTSALGLDEVPVDANAVLGNIGDGFRIAMSGLDVGRIGIAAQAVGIARGALDLARSYARQREQFRRPIASFQAIQWMIAEAATDIEAARLLALRAAALRDAGKPFTVEAAKAKLYASEAANRAVYGATQVFGGYGYMREYPVERYYRDARVTTIYEGTSEVQRMVIARELLA
jgi:alkylation response protein AidB-like acyl-CoA dehydrogenase